MTDNRSTFFTRHDFKNEYFYYFSTISHEKRHIIGDKISQFGGVNINFLIILSIENKFYTSRKYKYFNIKGRRCLYKGIFQ
jgi:hypothetical protein